MRHRLPLYAALLALVVISWNTWWGDPLIYLSYSGAFQFNPGEFSASMTSPVWHLLTFKMGPTLFRVFAAFVAFVALWRIMDRGSEARELLAGALIFPMLLYGVMGYETALAILLTVNFWDDRTNRTAWLLPLVRPESALLLAWAYRREWKRLAIVLAPFGLWAVIAYSFGQGLTSIETRLDDFNFRYLAVFWTWGALWASRKAHLTVPALLLGGALMFKTVQGAYVDTKKGWDYDTISLREVSEYVNTHYDSVTVGAYEIQIRQHLKPSIRVVSTEGLAGDGLPTVWIATDRNDNGREVMKRWEIKRDGFLQWVEVRH